jgi:hypothetical protein
VTALAPGSATTLLVIANQPVPGRVKTRLVPPRTPGQAAARARAPATGRADRVGGEADRVRCAQLLAPGGRILIEAEPGNVDEQLTARLEHPDGRRGPVFPWARMGTAALLRTAADAGLQVTGQWRHADRAFVCAAKRGPREADLWVEHAV